MEEIQQKRNIKREVEEWLESVMIALAFMIFLFVFVIGIVIVNGDSMDNILQDGQRLITLPVFYQAGQGDIVVIHRDEERPILKRVIACGGQTVDIDFRTGAVTLDREMLDEPYVSSQISDYDEDRMLSFPVEVPEDRYFVMGDNRGNSLDSRYREVGIIRENQIFGKVVLRIYPFQAMGTDF